MDYAQQQRNPTRHLMGIGGVVLLHIIIVYALVSGLARKVVEVVKGPIEVKVIEEQVQKPPPPPENLPPPPKLAAPPPPFIPPPEVNVAPPPAPAAITAITQEAPPAPSAPVITKVESAPAAAIVSAAVQCPGYKDQLSQMPYPREADLENIQGDVGIEFTVAANGQIRNVSVVKPAHRVLNRAALNAVTNRITCNPPGRDQRVSVVVSFTKPQ